MQARLQGGGERIGPAKRRLCGPLLRGLGLRLRRRHVIAVAVETAARLAAQEARIHQFLLHDGRREARVAVIGVEDGLRDGVIDVVADQVHQLERAHAEAAAVAHHRIDRGRVGGLFEQQAQPLRVIRTGHAVDDEAGRRLRVHRILAPGRGGRIDGVGGGLAGGDARDHFHQRHQRHRIEEVHAGEAFGALQFGTDRGDGDRRRVRGEDAVRPDDAFQVGEQGALDVEVFDHGFHHERGILRFVERAHRVHALAGEIRFRRAHAAFFDQPCQGFDYAGDGLVDGFRPGVEQPHGMSGHGRHLGDAGAHRAAADDGDDAVLVQCLGHLTLP